MTVTPQEIARLAALARIPLTAAEADSLRADLDAMLAHVRTLGALAHRSARPFAGPGPDRALLRPDGGLPDPMLLSADALAPEWEDGFFLVPRLAWHTPPHVQAPGPSMVGAAVGWSAYADRTPADVGASADAAGLRPVHDTRSRPPSSDPVGRADAMDAADATPPVGSGASAEAGPDGARGGRG
jgi:aspartyl-tRNA(Asn)/glutamyl-tRNA(Gln) amidotransferase subunit C